MTTARSTRARQRSASPTGSTSTRDSTRAGSTSTRATPHPADPPPTAEPADDDAATSTSRPVFTFAEAADVCGVSRTTVKRKHAAGAFPNARKEQRNSTPTWVVPVEDLQAAGLHPGRPRSGDTASTAAGTSSTTRATTSSAPAEQLAAELAAARAQAELAATVARAELAEAQLASAREHIDSLRVALRMLDAGPSTSTGHADRVVVEHQPARSAPASTDEPRRRLFRRRPR